MIAACGTWRFGLQVRFAGHPANRTHNPQLHTRPTNCKPKRQVPQAATVCITLDLLGTKCNSLTQQFIGISTTIDTWATCFDSIESSSGPQRLQIQFLQGSQVHCGIPNAYIIAS